MEGRFDRGHEEEDSSTPTTTPENAADSLLSADEEIHAPSPKRSRRGTQKRVVTVSMGGGDGDGEGFRSKTEAHPPPDSWSWRKYGQKPIKGSPYPRGYYRCSSSKGCPAKKQVERSRHDPTALMVTYSSEHNHPLPAAAVKPHHDHTPPPPASKPEPTQSSSVQAEEETAAADDGFAEFVGEFGWVCEVGSTMMNETTFIGPSWVSADVEMIMPIGEEDKLLFGDLGELPEYSLVSRRCVEGTTYSR